MIRKSEIERKKKHQEEMASMLISKITHTHTKDVMCNILCITRELLKRKVVPNINFVIIILEQ